MNIFCKRILLSLWVNSLWEADRLASSSPSSSVLGRSKKRYRHLTRVEGTLAAVITLAIIQPSLIIILTIISRETFDFIR